MAWVLIVFIALAFSTGSLVSGEEPVPFSGPARALVCTGGSVRWQNKVDRTDNRIVENRILEGFPVSKSDGVNLPCCIRFLSVGKLLL